MGLSSAACILCLLFKRECSMLRIWLQPESLVKSSTLRVVWMLRSAAFSPRISFSFLPCSHHTLPLKCKSGLNFCTPSLKRLKVCQNHVMETRHWCSGSLGMTMEMQPPLKRWRCRQRGASVCPTRTQVLCRKISRNMTEQGWTLTGPEGKGTAVLWSKEGRTAARSALPFTWCFFLI